MNYYIKKPNQRRKSFGIYKQVVKPNGSTTNKTVKHPDITSINDQFLSGILDVHDAQSLFKALKSRLAGNAPIVLNNENQKALDAFLLVYFKRKRFLVDQDAAKNKFTRAIKALGAISLRTASEDDILDAVLKHGYEANKSREVVHKLNSILKWLKRDVVVSVPPPERAEVDYLDKQQVEQLATSFDAPIKQMILLAFYSGLRIGELYAIRPKSIKADNLILVDSQLDRTEKRRLPKNRKQRRAFVHPDGIDALKYVVNNPVMLSRFVVSKRFKSACKTMFNKSYSWHDLRHSYAVYLISSGIPIQLVAQSMGNSVKVCEEYYSGHVLSDLGAETISSLLTLSSNPVL